MGASMGGGARERYQRKEEKLLEAVEDRLLAMVID